MKELSFYNVKTKKKVKSTKYKLVSKRVRNGTRYFAVAFVKGQELWRIVSKDFYMENK